MNNMTKQSQQQAVTIPACQILIVTGKGGVGKTAVATALAVQSANNGKRTLLVNCERNDVSHPLLNCEVSYGLNQAGANLWVSRLDARLSMKEYIHRTIPLHHLYDWIMDGQVLTQFTDAAPGFDELMCLGKLYDLAEGSNGKAIFEQIIFDAPATGHCSLMLRTPLVTAKAVRTGPMFHKSMLLHDMLADPKRCCMLVVALAEEMAILEGRELHRYVRDELNFKVGPMIVNRVRPQRFSAAEIDHLRKKTPQSPQITAVIDNAISHYQLSSLQAEYVKELRDAMSEVIEVPQIIQQRYCATGLVNALAASLQPAVMGAK